MKIKQGFLTFDEEEFKKLKEYLLLGFNIFVIFGLLSLFNHIDRIAIFSNLVVAIIINLIFYFCKKSELKKKKDKEGNIVFKK